MEQSWKGLSCSRSVSGQGDLPGVSLRAKLLATAGLCHHHDARFLSAGAGVRVVLLQLRSLRNLVQLGSEAVPSDQEDMFSGEVHAT